MGIKYSNRTYAKLIHDAKEIASRQVRVEDRTIEAFNNKELTESEAREILSTALFSLDQINEWFE